MPKLKMSLIFLIFLLILVPVHGKASEKEALTGRLMKMSGLEEQLNQIKEHVFANLNEAKETLPAEVYEAITQAMAEAYEGKKMREIVSARLSANLNIEEMRGILNWLQSGLGRKITGLEEAASTPEAFESMQTFTRQLQINPPTPQRLELSQRLDYATNATTMAVDIILLTAYGVAAALDTIMPEDQRTDLDKLREEIESQRPELTPFMQQMTIASFLFTYRTLGDAEIERYIAFYESDLGKRYNLVVGAAFMNAMLEATEIMRAELMNILKGLPSMKSA
jgi:uncharacterized protein (UPF0335 family)